MPAVYFAIDVVVQTSDNEGTPVSLIEAQAAGVPVVSTRVGGTASVVVDGQTGVLAEPDDEERFAMRLKVSCSEDSASRARWASSRQNSTLFERFTLDRLRGPDRRLYAGLELSALLG